MVSVQIAALLAALASGGETVLLDFHASWCAPCRSMEAPIAELERAGYPIRKVNIDNERALANQFNVQSIPCFVLLVDGREVARSSGAIRRDQLVAMFQQANVQPRSGSVTRGQSPDAAPPGATNPPARPGVDPFGDRAASTAPPLGLTSPPPSRAVTSQDLIQSSVRLTISDPQGFSHGSGTMIDSRQGEALVLTCGHIFRDSAGKGQITVDLFGPGAPQKVPGRLIKYDLKSDVALVTIKPGVPVRVAPVASRSYRFGKGDRVITVGCNNGGPATAMDTKITNVDKFQGPPNVQVAGLPVQGRSGGGLFTADGQVIGVCNAADPADNEGLYAALPAIHSHLDSVGLTTIYQRPLAAPAAALANVRQLPGPVAEATADAVAAVSRPMGAAGLNDADRAVLAQLGQRADSAEVICIVRPLNDPRAKSEVIKLDRASSAFLQQLAVDRQAQESRHLTSLRSAAPARRNPVRTSELPRGTSPR